LSVYPHPARLIRHQLSLTCALLVGAGLLAPAASAQRDCQAPPGRAAIEQYCEVLPSAGGDRSAGSGGGGSGGEALAPSVRRQLHQAGAAGDVISALAGGSAGVDKAPGGGSGDGRSGEGAGGGASASSGGGAASSGGVPGEPSDNPLDAVRSAAEAGPSSGSGLLWALAAATVLLAAFAWLRHRRRAEPQ
jgi:hypothetical protein